MNVITTTLASGTTLAIEPSATFGDIFLAGLALAVLTVLALQFVFNLVYRK